MELENKEVEVPNTNTNSESEENKSKAVEFSAEEERARESGWRPKEEYDGDPERWVDYAEFNRRGELIERIESLGKELKMTKKAMSMLQDHHKKVRETEYKRAVEQLKAQKKLALENADYDRVVELDEHIATAKEAVKQAEAESKAQEEEFGGNELPPEFVAWKQSNRWYDANDEMQEYADTIGIGYKQKHPEKSYNEVLKYVEEKVRKTFKTYFENPNRTRASGVEEGGRPARKGGDSFDLTEDERRIMNTFVQQGVMTKDEYIAELKRVRGA